MSLLLLLEEPNSREIEMEAISETQIDNGTKPLLSISGYQEKINMITLPEFSVYS